MITVELKTNKDTFKDLLGNIKYYLLNSDRVILKVTDQYKDYDLMFIYNEFDLEIHGGRLIIDKTK
jgi:hypothetical protein